jgi:transcriptional regulator with XRE-family HTH domain
MKSQASNGKKKVLSTKLYKSLRKIGGAFKALRKEQGFGNSVTFAISKNISESQYGKYEAGSENMTIESLLDTAELFGLTDEDVFNPKFLDLVKGNNSLSDKSRNILITQVRHQVDLLLGEQKANEFDNDDIERIYTIIASCCVQLSKKQIIKKLGLKSKTPNLESLMQFTIGAQWLAMTYPNAPNRHDQKYYTTEKGKGVLKIKHTSTV